MTNPAFEDLVETFLFLGDWEERYRHLIEIGKALPPLDETFKTPLYKVEGCASQVWLVPRVCDDIFDFQADSDGMIVRGLIAVLRALYAGQPTADIMTIDAKEQLARLGLNEHLSAQRSNGLRAMVGRLQQAASENRGNHSK